MAKKHGEKFWKSFFVEFNSNASPPEPGLEPGRTDVAFGYGLFANHQRASHGVDKVYWNYLDTDGVALVKAGWASLVAAMAKHGFSINATGRTEFTNVANKMTHRFYRAFRQAVKKIQRDGEKASKMLGRSVPEEKDED